MLAFKVVLSVSLLFAYLASAPGAGLSLDEESYFAWAQRILAGDWLGRGPFFQDPLYPYVLAGLIRLGGESLMLARFVNVALGVLSLVLLERVVRGLFSPGMAVWAAALWSLVGTVVLDEVTLSKEPLMVALMLAAASLALGASGPRISGAFASGLLAGALVLVRGNFLALLPLASWFYLRHLPRRSGIVAVAGLGLFPALFALRNGVQEGRPLPSTAATGMVFFMGHSDFADGTWAQAPFVRGNPLHEIPDYVTEASRRLGREVTAYEASRYFLGQGLAFIQEHPGQELALLFKKVRLTFSWEEVPGNYSRSCLRDRFLPGLWLAPLSGALLWPLALAAVMALWRRPVVQFLALGAGLYALTLWATFVVERYRLPLWVAAVVLAPAGALHLRQAWDSAYRARVVFGAALCVALLAWPVREGAGKRELAHCLALAGATLLQEGYRDEALPLLQEAAALYPDSSQSHFNLGVLFASKEDWPQAANAFARYLERASPAQVKTTCDSMKPVELKRLLEAWCGSGP